MDLDNKSDVGMSEYGDYCVHGGVVLLCVSVGLDKEVSLGTEAGGTSSLLLGTVDVDCSLDVETLLYILVTDVDDVVVVSITEAGETSSLLLGTVDVDCSLDVET